MPEWAIRSASERDLESILGLWASAGGPVSVSDTRVGLACLLERDREALLLAEQNGVVIGSLIAAWDGWRGSFYKLAVHPGHRRRGLATELLREGERRLRARGAIRLTAIVIAGDAAATGFWEAAGYARQGDRARFVRQAGAER